MFLRWFTTSPKHPSQASLNPWRSSRWRCESFTAYSCLAPLSDAAWMRPSISTQDRALTMHTSKLAIHLDSMRNHSFHVWRARTAQRISNTCSHHPQFQDSHDSRAILCLTRHLGHVLQWILKGTLHLISPPAHLFARRRLTHAFQIECSCTAKGSEIWHTAHATLVSNPTFAHPNVYGHDGTVSGGAPLLRHDDGVDHEHRYEWSLPWGWMDSWRCNIGFYLLGIGRIPSTKRSSPQHPAFWLVSVLLADHTRDVKKIL